MLPYMGVRRPDWRNAGRIAKAIVVFILLALISTGLATELSAPWVAHDSLSAIAASSEQAVQLVLKSR